jgi:hypothetical protein
MDAHGWHPYFEGGVNPEQRRRFWDIARAQYHDAFGPLRLSRHADKALEALLALCRESRISVALTVPPESNAFRALYPPAMLEGVQSYVETLSLRHGLPLIDGHDWVEDEGFWDGHHALPKGAVAFTRRLQDEALVPLLRSPSDITHPVQGPSRAGSRDALQAAAVR